MNVLFCGKTNTPITSCIMHQHENWEIILHISGHVKSNIGGKIYDISPGDIMIIPPETSHDGQSDEEYMDMYVQCRYLSVTDIQVLHDHDGAMMVLMNLLHKVMAENGRETGQIADNLLQTICSYINKYNSLKSTTHFVTDLKNEMYDNLANADFSVGDAVRKTGFNTDYVRRCFKEETGMTPLEYLTNMRMNYAQGLLLQETYVSVVDVAEKCGYGDSFYFSRLFKKKFGVSPLKYRRDFGMERRKIIKNG